MGKSLEDYQTIESMCKKYPQFSKMQFRWLIQNKERFKISHVLKRVGKRIYIHVPSFLRWVEKQEA